MQKVFFLIALTFLAFIARLPSLEEPFDNDSSANAYHARLILRGEPLYGTHHPAHHMPGASYTYALAFVLFGERDISVKLLLIPWTALTAWFIYKLGVKLKDHIVGLLAVIIFVMLTSQLKLKGTTAELELFANLPAVWAIYLALQFTEQKNKLHLLFWSGVLCGVTLIYKVSLIFPIAAVGALFFALLWQEAREGLGWRQVVTSFAWRCLALLAGLVVVAFLVCGLFAWQGVLDGFLLTFRLGQGYLAYTSSLPAYRIILIPLIILAYNNAVLLMFGLAGFLRLIYAARRRDLQLIPIGAMLAAWLVVSFLITGITKVGYVHYALIAVPPLALIATWEIRNVTAQMVSRLKLEGRRRNLPLAISLIIVVISSLVFNYSNPYHYIRYRLGLESFDEYITSGTFEGHSLVDSLNVAKYIAQNTDPGDYIFNWSDYPQVYFYSDRQSPIETIWPYYATAFGSYKRIFVPRTKYIILGHSIYLEVPEWMNTELAQDYQLETMIGNYQLFRRKSP